MESNSHSRTLETDLNSNYDHCMQFGTIRHSCLRAHLLYHRSSVGHLWTVTSTSYTSSPDVSSRKYFVRRNRFYLYSYIVASPTDIIRHIGSFRAMSSTSDPQPHTDTGGTAGLQTAPPVVEQEQKQLSEDPADMSLFSLDRPRDCISGTAEVIS